MTTEEQQRFLDVIKRNSFTPEEAYNLSQSISRKRKQDEGLPILGNGYIGNFVGGAGSSFLRGVGDVAGFLNLNNVSDALNSGADSIEERLPDALPAEFSWEYMTSPSGWARGTGNVGGSIASIVLPTVLAPESTFLRGAQFLSNLSKGKIGLDVAKRALQGASTSIPESMMEAGNFERNAVANGMNPEEARQKSWGVFGRNLGILGLSNTAQGALLPKLLGKGNPIRGRLKAGAGELGMQSLEEGWQSAAESEMAGKPYSYNPLDWLTDPKYKEQLQAVKEGLFGVAPFTAVGVGGGVIRDKYFAKDEDKEFERQPAGAFENKYWRKQHDNVKYEGAQPQTMKAIDALGKWFYEKTGAPLIVTSVTDGKSHTDGEHSHYNGWKVDVNDYGSGMEGAITTEDGKKGWLADEFIRYGQSLGLGMNWEGDHIDVAVDGTQWDGLSEVKNFGGFKYSANETDTEKTPAQMTKEEFFAAVAGQESGGDYNAENGRTGAFGKYQIMPENWKTWAAEAGLSPDAPMTPENQEIVAKFKLGQYFDKYGASGALVAWYAGERNGQRWKDGKPDAIGENGNYSWDARQGNGDEPSIREYVQQTLGRINVQPQEENNADNEPETPKGNSYFVDEVIKNLLRQNTPLNFKIEKQTPLTRAVYEDFVFSKMHDDTDAESEINKSFFEQHPELFDKNGKLIFNNKTRGLLADEFGVEEIADFGQKLIADRIAAIRNIQTPKDSVNFKTSEFTNKNGDTISVAELASKLPKNIRQGIENIAAEYGVKRGKYNRFNFKKTEDRDKFIFDAENYIQSLQEPPAEIQPVNPVQENITPAQTHPPAEIQPEYMSQEEIDKLLAQSQSPAEIQPVNPVQENITPAQTHPPAEIQPVNPVQENITPAQTHPPAEIQPEYMSQEEIDKLLAQSQSPAEIQPVNPVQENISPAEINRDYMSQEEIDKLLAQSQSPAEIQPVNPVQENITPAQTQPQSKINFGNTAVESYKQQFRLDQSQSQKFDENMSKPVTHNGETMTRQKLIEKVATGEIEESEVKTNAGERNYLNYLRDEVVKPIQAIQNAGISDKTASQEYHFQLLPYSLSETTENVPFSEMSVKVEVPAQEQKTFAKDTSTVENLTKLAESLGGKFDDNAFIFGKNSSAAVTFRAAANLFSGNKHLEYLQTPAVKKSDTASVAYSLQTAQEISRIPDTNLREAYEKARIADYPILKTLIDTKDTVRSQQQLSEFAAADDKDLATTAITEMKYDSTDFTKNKLDKIQSDIQAGEISPIEGYTQAFNIAYGKKIGTQEFSNLMDSKKLGVQIGNLFENFRAEIARENGISLEPTNFAEATRRTLEIDAKIKEKGVRNDAKSKADFMPVAVAEGLISADSAYETVRKMLYGTESEKVEADNLYENLQQSQNEKLQADYEKAVVDGTYQKIIDKFPELETEFNQAFKKIEAGGLKTGKSTLDEFVDNGEEYQAREAIRALDDKLRDKHGEEIKQLEKAYSGMVFPSIFEPPISDEKKKKLDAAIKKDEQFKWFNVSEEIHAAKNSADKGEISYVDAYQKVKQVLQDTGLEEGLSDEQIATNERRAHTAQIQKLLDWRCAAHS